MKACLVQYIPEEDQNLGMTELSEKHPDKVNLIKSKLYTKYLLYKEKKFFFFFLSVFEKLFTQRIEF